MENNDNKNVAEDTGIEEVSGVEEATIAEEVSDNDTDDNIEEVIDTEQVTGTEKNNPKKQNIFKNKRIAAAIVAVLVVVAIAITLPIIIMRNRNNDPVVATVNGVEILASDVRSNIGQAEQIHMFDYMMMFPDDEDFDYDKIFRDGQTFGRVLLEEAVKIQATAILFKEIAEQMHITLTDDEIAEVETLVENQILQMGHDEFYFALRQMGITDRDHLFRIWSTSRLIETVITAIILTPNFFSNYEQYLPDSENLLGAKHILANFENFDSEEEAEQYAASLLERALAGEDFDMLVSEYGQDPGMFANPDGYTFGPGEMVPEFEDATRELAIGEISGLVRSFFGYHIIMRTEPQITEGDMRAAIIDGVLSMRENAEFEFFSTLDDIDVAPVLPDSPE